MDTNKFHCGKLIPDQYFRKKRRFDNLTNSNENEFKIQQKKFKLKVSKHIENKSTSKFNIDKSKLKIISNSSSPELVSKKLEIKTKIVPHYKKLLITEKNSDVKIKTSRTGIYSSREYRENNLNIRKFYSQSLSKSYRKFEKQYSSDEDLNLVKKENYNHNNMFEEKIKDNRLFMRNFYKPKRSKDILNIIPNNIINTNENISNCNSLRKINVSPNSKNAFLPTNKTTCYQNNQQICEKASKNLICKSQDTNTCPQNNDKKLFKKKFIARPLPSYPLFEVIKSKCSLTIPRSPKLKTKSRSLRKFT